MPATLGYWNLRGLAQHIRFLLEYTGEDYQEKLYNMGPAPDYSRKHWLDEKFTLGLDFPNLPYYVDGDVKLTQSHAICRYLARKHNLIANKTEEEAVLTDMLEQEALDIRMNFAMMCLTSEFETLKEEYISKTAPAKFKELSEVIGNKKWFTGDKITYVDFFLYEALLGPRYLEPALFDPFRNLKKFMERFEALEPIKKYMKSDRYIERPYNGPSAYYLSK